MFIGYNKMSQSGFILFESSDQIGPPEMAKCGQNVHKVILKHELVRAKVLAPTRKR